MHLRWMLLCGIVGLAGCSAVPDRDAKAPQPRLAVDQDRLFSGRWYEVARTPQSITDGCEAGFTDYSTRDGKLRETDGCYKGGVDGKLTTLEGPLRILNPPANNKVFVQYTLFGVVPIAKTWWMLDHDPDYQWFIMSDAEFKTVSLYTRAPRPGQALIAKLADDLASLGFDAKKLEYPALLPPGRR